MPTQEKALYVSPSWVHHGHWIQREDGSLTLTRMVMHQLKEPPKDDDWIGLEDELNPIEARRRIRGKVSLQHLRFGGESPQPKDEDVETELGEEEEREDEIRRMKKVVEKEMAYAVEDDHVASFLTLDAITSMKELTNNPKAEEILQTKVVSG